ncbi:hypothetical protein [Rugamonas rubra]|uniref:Uncharacterized protein n=1 Tax=Rugamonas rubra TaxID=758825 RepID=A0A1I4LXW4_9BURK|nr:hypothetical protein [Rugamonas rubra]SFL95675.1 hypothetical protein SAMN02982985_02106 [Rugamonas rubra]
MERRKHPSRANTSRPKPWKAARDPRIQDLQAATDVAAFAACFEASPNIACRFDAEQRLLNKLPLHDQQGRINSGEIYRFYTKPWDDQNLRANIQESFQYHQLIHGQAHEA